MPKYYCDYCKSYLTHDTMSVRKSHLMGKNHIRFYCNYYEMKAKERGIWAKPEKTFLLSYVLYNHHEPGSDQRIDALLQSIKQDQETENRSSGDQPSQISDEDMQIIEQVEANAKAIPPPPPTLDGFPKPPPSVLRTKGDYQRNASKRTF